ncbi:MAG: diacylglycerol kinase family protein [Pseudomonadota bacterium]
MAQDSIPIEARFAVILNANAKRVSREVEELIGEVVPPEDLYLSSSSEEAASITEEIVNKGYGVVFAGGGDGTVMDFLDQISRVAPARRPAVGILKLGTGNAMSRLVSSGNVFADLKTFSATTPRDVFSLGLLEAEGRRFPFAGLGLDAEILNDYRILKRAAHSGLMKRLAQSVSGYFVAFFIKTLPRMLGRAVLRHHPRVRAIALDEPVLLVAPDGTEIRRYASGETFYEGNAISSFAGTVPYYGYGLKILPLAGTDPQRMHLRIADIAVLRALVNLRPLWRGNYVGTGLHNFLASSVRLEFDREMPFQIGGDAEGLRQSVEFRMVPEAVRLLHLL